jgi:hypothetical protein
MSSDTYITVWLLATLWRGLESELPTMTVSRTASVISRSGGDIFRVLAGFGGGGGGAEERAGLKDEGSRKGSEEERILLWDDFDV